ncbi:MAG: aminomethyl-transferring glycine dehydrogenase subunit GcvPA [Clostridiales Family XIII bacterium]|jgi:glycine dehydrogenase subunit 1|nr:aminomethyl-transferring glycine dehydrogenase subunit GcvPA [Clostridiales Family XIII bacterium]
MNTYIPATQTDREAMLKEIGAGKIEDLFRDIPEEIRFKGRLDLAAPLSEPELLSRAHTIARKNRPVDELACFLGAGAYDRNIPAAIRHLTLRSEFYTAYTPYQPEISQGTLQAIFEFQTMITQLTGTDAANASVYDGSSACAEAMLMAKNQTRRKQALVSKAIHPDALATISTYARFHGIEVVGIDTTDGATDAAHLSALISDETAAVIVQSPNFFGVIEDVAAMAPAVHEKKSLLVAYVADAASLAVLEAPGKLGADIVCGEGQSFGLGLNYGGPYLGFMGAKANLMRKLPGRIVGETTDVDGRRAYVLTLQAREQHIRREKATSNICTNQGLNALSATIYLSLLGTEGLKDVALQSMNKARYLKSKLAEAGIRPLFGAPFFDEFVVLLKDDAHKVNEKLLAHGILGGYPIGAYLPGEFGADRDKAMLFCVTEKRTQAEMDKLADLLRE